VSLGAGWAKEEPATQKKPKPTSEQAAANERGESSRCVSDTRD